jgi:hypothetical protein
MWMKIGIGVAAVLLAVVVGTGAYAMWGADTDDDGQQTTREIDEDTTANPQTASEDGEGGDALGICIEGTVDCVDTPLNPEDAGGGTESRRRWGWRSRGYVSRRDRRLHRHADGVRRLQAGRRRLSR